MFGILDVLVEAVRENKVIQFVEGLPEGYTLEIKNSRKLFVLTKNDNVVGLSFYYNGGWVLDTQLSMSYATSVTHQLNNLIPSSNVKCTIIKPDGSDTNVKIYD